MGDAFGMLNGLFGSLTLAAAFAAVALQWTELGHAIDEMSNMSSAQQGQVDATAAHTEELRIANRVAVAASIAQLRMQMATTKSRGAVLLWSGGYAGWIDSLRIQEKQQPLPDENTSPSELWDEAIRIARTSSPATFSHQAYLASRGPYDDEALAGDEVFATLDLFLSLELALAPLEVLRYELEGPSSSPKAGPPGAPQAQEA